MLLRGELQAALCAKLCWLSPPNNPLYQNLSLKPFSQTQITENTGRNSAKILSKSETHDFSNNQIAHATACALTPVAYMHKLVDMHLL